MTEQLYRIELPYATFGLVSKDERIIRAPPIARWTVGKHTADVLTYYARRGAGVTLCSLITDQTGD